MDIAVQIADPLLVNYSLHKGTLTVGRDLVDRNDGYIVVQMMLSVVGMHCHSVGQLPNTASEEVHRAQHHSELSPVEVAVPPAVRGGHQPSCGDEGGPAY